MKTLSKSGSFFANSIIAILGLFVFVLSAFADVPAVGPLKIATTVVPDINQAVTQWGAATGSQFMPVQTTTVKVRTPNAHGVSITDVTLKRAYTVRSAPFVSFEQATPAIGPWSPSFDVAAPGFMGYAVSNVASVGAQLVQNGMVEVASAIDYSFAIYQAYNGILVELIRSDLVPSAGGTNVAQSDIDLGTVAHTDLSVRQFDVLKKQLGDALSLQWGPDFVINNNPFLFTGANGVVDNLVYTDVRVGVSTNNPQVQLENVVPNLGVFAASNSNPVFHVAYTFPGTLETVTPQMAAAGFVLNTQVIIPGLGLVLAYYVNSHGLWVEVVDKAFDL